MTGRAFVLGDNIDTDVLAPGQYMHSGAEVLASHCLEAVDPAFAKTVGPGAFVVAGKNFGIGSSREQAVQSLKLLGVAGVIARSFGGIFHRNAINLGLPVMVCNDTARITDGAMIDVDLKRGVIILAANGEAILGEALPAFLVEMLEGGGLIPHLEKRFATPKAL